MDHVLIRKPEHLTGSAKGPSLGFAIETRDRPGPVHKNGAFEGDNVWIQLQGGVFVAKAKIRICWIGEFSKIAEVRARTRGSALYDVDSFWTGRPKYGYAAVASLMGETWTDPFWAGPRSYGYEWVILDDEKKRASWLDRKPAPRTAGEDVLMKFRYWMKTHP
jgi:hypothetical protein